MNKAMKLRGVVSALLALSCLAFAAQTQDALAQRPTRTVGPPPRPLAAPPKPVIGSRTVTPTTKQPAKNAAGSRTGGKQTRAITGGGGVPPFTHVRHADWSQIPSSITRRRLDTKKITKAVGDENVTRQTNLITYTSLLPGATASNGVKNNGTVPLPLPGLPSAAPNYQPNWSADERYIYFTSRRNSATDTTPNATGIYNIYQTFPDGSGVTQLSIPSTAGNEIEPNIAGDGFRLAYAGGGVINTNSSGVPVNSTGQVNGQFSTSGFKLYYFNITSGAVTPLTERNPQNISFLDIRHPSWSPGGNQIAFAAETSTDQTHYHIYKVNTDTGNITQLTSGPSNDTAPAWSPDGNVIAITTNATAFSVVGSNNPLVSQGTKPTTDIWVVNQNLFTPDSTQVTNSASVPNSVATNNRSAAWSTLRTDLRGFIPGTQLLAFASDRVPIATTVGTTTTISWGLSANGSTDIYYVQATVAQDPAANNAFTVTTPESGAPGGAAGNPALGLTTSASDLLSDGTGHNSVPTNTPEYAASFDPNRTTSEDYPTWPQFINSYRITFQSNSNGQGATTPTENIWASTVLDINAPTLIKYDIQNNQVVGVFHDSPAPPAPGADTNSYAREFAAGETVRFRVKVADYESGIAAVYLQIKCPDSLPQSSDGLEHKTYFDGAALKVPVNPRPPYSALDGTNATGVLGGMGATNGTPIELEMQAINANILDPGFNTFPQTAGSTVINAGIPPPNALLGANGPTSFGPIPATYPGTNDFLASLDDQMAFSGSGVLKAFTPGTPESAGVVNYWLPLHDNGPDPNPAHTTLASQAGNEPRGEIGNDGIWTGSWQTPANLPSDWVVDVIVFDKAISPFGAGSNNWKIYDNVWGFTTRPFQVDPRTTLLYVNDYDEGQKFFATPAGTFGAFNANAESPIGIPTESWMTEFDPALLPASWWTWPPPTPMPGGLLLLTLTTLGSESYGTISPPNDPLAGYQPPSTAVEGTHDNDGSPIPPTQRYAQWRILCRGAVPDSVLNAFAPRQETQPADIFTPNSQPRTVTVAERCVVWHSPYAGDLLIGAGTILDRAVQSQLTNFVGKGGRLFLSGQDVAFGLTSGTVGAGASPFLENIFQVRYASDQGATRTITMQAGNGIHPIATQTFVNGSHYFPSAGTTFNPPSAGTITLNGYSYGDNALRGANLAACPNPYLLNTITATMAEQPGIFGIDGYYNSTASPNIVWYTNTTNGSKVVFSCLPWEAITPGFFTAATPPNAQNPPMTQTLALQNRLAELMHNTLDYLRTGRIVGTIRSVNSGGVGGGQGLRNVFVRAVGTDSTGTAVVTGTTLTQADGSYVIDGLDPTGQYTIDAAAAGFIAQHVSGDYFHGGYQTQIDAYLTPALPGNINGTVVVKASGAKVPGAIVTATDPVSGATFSATTDINGAFSILNVPAIYNPTNPTSGVGYVVRVTNLAALGYGSSTPYSYGLFKTELPTNFPDAQAAVQVGNPTSPNVTLLPAGQPAGSPSFSLIANPGTLTGQVFARDSNGATTTNPIAGAVVTVTLGAFSATATTNATGNYTLSGLAPGSYQATVAASGYATSASVAVVVVSDPGNTPQNFYLSLANPGSLVVTVTDGVNPVGGATVLLQTATGATLTFVGGGSIAAPVESPTGTYTFAAVPAGSVQILVSKPGYKAADANPKTVTVSSTPTGGTATPATASFILVPKATFDAGLTMISTPQDYSTLSPAPSIFTLLGSGVELFTWNPSRGAYDENPPKNGATIGLTDTLHRGQGYFLYAPTGTILTTDGSPTDESPTAAPFDVTLKSGWNMIGDPYSFPVDFSQLSIVRSDNSTVLTSASTDISNALFTYLGGGYTTSNTVDAYRGYWLYAFNPVRLRFTTAAKVTRAITRAVGNNTSSGEWRIDLVAQAGDGHQATGYLGVSRAASDGFDHNKALAPPTMGAENVTLTFDHTDWGNQSGHYAVDVRSAGLTSQTWNFTVNSSVANTPITLHWPAIATIPGRQSLTLTDLDSNHTMNLRSQNSYVIPASDKPITRHFSLQMTRAGKLKLQVSDLVAHNSGGGGRAAGVVVSYRISSEADVQVNILRNGQRIRALTPSVHRAAGVTDTPWDMRDDKGVTVAGDTYTVEVRATDADGNIVRRVSPLLVTR